MTILCIVGTIESLLIVVNERVNPILEMISFLHKRRLVLISHLIDRMMVISTIMIVEAWTFLGVKITVAKLTK